MTIKEQILQSIEGDEHSHTECSFFCDEGEFIFSTEYVMTEKGEPAGEFTPEIQDTYEHEIIEIKRNE